jgi:NitT/TauT family transport system permease protein
MRSEFSWTAFWRGVAGIAAFVIVWEVFARSGFFSRALSPPLGSIANALWQTFADGSMPQHALVTLGRVLLGIALSCLIAIPLGMVMGRVRAMERFFLPLVSVLMPIPSLAWVPLFILWFGIGNITTILVVIYAATFPMVYSVWTGVRSINPLWLRAGAAMGANRRALFWKVVWPGALPFVITGLRLSFGRAWIAVVGGELLASPTWGLGKVIFDAKEFLNADVMLAALIVIGALGLTFERVVFQALETRTVGRWGMVAAARR